jgi:hypothetical protein
MNNKDQFLALIQSNVDKYGYHVTIVYSELEPRYAYTIGLTKIFGFELIFAGGCFFMEDQLFIIFDAIVKELRREMDVKNIGVAISNLGSFSLSKVDPSWSKIMMLGVFDYYKTTHIETFQIIPDSNHRTLDVPDMTQKWNTFSSPIWQWLALEWDYAVPKNSTVVTNLDALYGKAITEVMRWEKNEWEMFAGTGPDVEKIDIRVVSLGTLLGIDKSLYSALQLKVGKGLWRNSILSEWNQWG